ncbi:PAS domain S-box protein, partial [Patescibacteria group bacterium]
TKAKEMISEVEKSSNIQSKEINFIHKSGYFIPTEFSGSLIQIDKNITEGIVLTVRDIVERKESQKKVEKINTELRKINSFMIGREKKMTELKEQIADLKEQLSHK